jgi:uncharacterized UPF0160 family protein
VDVGAVYDESKQRFDHHQRGFEEVFGHGFTTKLSSAGLIYKSGDIPFVTTLLIPLFRHFGREIIASQLQLTLGDPKVDGLWLKLYKVLFMHSYAGLSHSMYLRSLSKHSMESTMGYRNILVIYKPSI